MNQIDLSGRRAVVTGGAQGIGLSIVKRFLASGAKVSLWDQDASLLEQACRELESKGSVHAVVVELSDADAVVEATLDAVKALGDIDIFVNNAGIAGPTEPSWEYALEDWRRVIDVDLNAVYYCCRAVVPRMREQDYGRIVNVASIAGKEGNPNASAYSSSKAGVIGLTKSLGKELALKNIAVNCVTPAAAKTRIFDQMTQEHIDYMLSKIPRNRFAKVNALASLVTWLASEENSFSTSAVFDLSGGRATY